MSITYHQSAETVSVNEFVEVTVDIVPPVSGNPFTDAHLSGYFQRVGSEERIAVDGFCDAQDGSVYRIRFLPTQAGEYAYTLRFQRNGEEEEPVIEDRFRVEAGQRKGLLRVDPAHPYHFLWEGTGEHYFWNGTTTYWLLGWDEETIRQAIDRLHRLQVNRLRVVLNGRVQDGSAWCENVFPSQYFTFLLNPWVAENPDSVEDPGFDVTRFNVAHWQKYERLVHYAHQRDMIVSVIFYVDGARPGVDPFGREKAGGEDEQRYYRYAAARLGAFSNITWDVTNEYRLFRDDAWAEKMGAYLREHDPYRHLMSVHGHGTFNFRTSPWADFAMYQSWDEHGGYAYMLKNREMQAETGRPIPQINEEYGYEDHYPQGWGEGRVSPARSAGNRRRLAWEMYFAGGYQTTGERADTENGGGWINGRGDDTMTMLEGYGKIVDFFQTFDWWKTEPRPDLVNGNALCLAEPGRQYALYLPSGGSATVRLEPGAYWCSWFNPRTGEARSLPKAEVGGNGEAWTSPDAPDDGDWTLLLQRAD